MPGKLGPALVVAGGLATVGAIAGGIAMASGFDPRPAPPAPPLTVVKVVDGDTFDIARDGQAVRIRLLNVDTPETVDPNRPPECGGAEAGAWLEERLPPGSVVTLGYDEERLDRYGRELAWVTAEDGGVVNLEVARQGLGEAVVVEPNHLHYQEVLSAQHQAKSDGVGLYDPTTPCTLPAQVTRQEEALAQAAATAATEGDPDLLAALAGTAAVDAALARAADTVDGRMIGGTTVAHLQDRLARADRAARTRQTELAEMAEAEAARAAAEEEAARQAQEDADRRAEETARREAAERRDQARQEADARRRAEVEEDRRRAEEENDSGPSAPDAPPAREEDQAREEDPVGDEDQVGDVGNDSEYPGYTGPRCYEPGGKVWHPC